jgi:hypothetical protein
MKAKDKEIVTLTFETGKTDSANAVMVLCHRCLRRAPRRGSHSASVDGSGGRRVRLYVCRRCCAELMEDWREWM